MGLDTAVLLAALVAVLVVAGYAVVVLAHRDQREQATHDWLHGPDGPDARTARKGRDRGLPPPQHRPRP